MSWSQFLSVENVVFLFGAFGWIFFVILAVLRFVAPKTDMTGDDDLLVKMEWIKNAAPYAFNKVKELDESDRLPKDVDRYVHYLVILGEAFSKTFGTAEKAIPEFLQPTAKLVADGMHAENKLIEAATKKLGLTKENGANPQNPPSSPVSQ